MQRSVPGSENNNEKTQKNMKRVTKENFIVFDCRQAQDFIIQLKHLMKVFPMFQGCYFDLGTRFWAIRDDYPLL